MRKRLFILSLSLLCFGSLSAQHIDLGNESLEEALKGVEQQTGVKIFYRQQDVRGITISETHGERKDLQNVLNYNFPSQ